MLIYSYKISKDNSARYNIELIREGVRHKPTIWYFDGKKSAYIRYGKTVKITNTNFGRGCEIKYIVINIRPYKNRPLNFIEILA